MTDPHLLTLIEVAREHREAGRLLEATSLLTAVLQVSPTNARAQHQLGLALLGGGYPDGLKLLESAARLEPGNTDCIADLGDARVGFSDISGGIAKLRSAVALAPTREDVMLRLAKCIGTAALLPEAEIWFRRLHCLRRRNAKAHVAHGVVLRHAGRIAESIPWFQRAVVEDQSHTEGLVALAGALHDVGAPLELVMKPGRIAAERVRDQPAVVMPVIQYLRDIGEESDSVRLATQVIDKEMADAAADDLGQHGFRILMSDDMVTRIGEIAFQLGLHVKMKLLGWLPPFISILLAPKEQVCNQPFLDHWRRYVTVVDDPRQIAVLEPLKDRILFNPVYVRLPDGRAISKSRAYVAVQEEWQRQGRGPLLELSHQEVEHGQAQLRRMGIPDGAWFVGVHVREAGYLKEGPNSSETVRNADIRSYLPAVEEVTRRGGWVVRLGDPSMTPLPPMAQVIDYPHSPFRSAEMDVFLMASCRFLLGTTSGPVMISGLFGVPVGAADFFPIGELLHTSKDIIIPKPYREKASGRMLSFEECLKMPLAFTYDSNHFASLGLEALPSEPEDIRELAIEMLERTEGKWPYDAEDERLNGRWHDLCRPFALGEVGCRVGRGFLRRHRKLFRSL